jgi:hypothetical protein
LETCRYVAASAPQQDEHERYYRSLAEQDGVFSMDMDRLVCPFLPICDPVIDHAIVKWDQNHLTDEFSQSIASGIDDYLKQVGIVPDEPSPGVRP